MYLLFQNTRDPISITLLHYIYSSHNLLLYIALTIADDQLPRGPGVGPGAGQCGRGAAGLPRARRARHRHAARPRGALLLAAALLPHSPQVTAADGWYQLNTASPQVRQMSPGGGHAGGDPAPAAAARIQL